MNIFFSENIRRLRKERDLSILFITHDLSAARIVADRLAIMYAGKIIEEGNYQTLIDKKGKFAELVERQRLDYK